MITRVEYNEQKYGSEGAAMAEPRLKELDGLRGLAALWVVIFHLTFGFSHLWAPGRPLLIAAVVPFSVNIRGLQAVDLFFIISGFVICMTVDRSRTVIDFAASRFARLFPAYWAAVAISTAIGLLLPSTRLPVTAGQGLINLSMLQSYIGVPLVDPSYWSLSFELGFYGLMAGILIGGCRHRIESIGLAWMVGGFALSSLLRQMGLAVPWRVSTALALPYASLFYAGILFYRLKADQFTWMRVWLLVLCLVLRCAPEGSLVRGIECSLFLIFALAVAGRLPVLGTRPMAFLGSISYSLYVIHQPMGYRIEVGLHALDAPAWINLAASVTALIAVAFVLNYVVERPGTRLLRQLYSAFRSSAVATRHASPDHG